MCVACLSSQLLQAADWAYTAFTHAVSHGDGFNEAPGALYIEPKVEPLSELIKYRLFDLNIEEADVHFLEGSNITRVQVREQSLREKMLPPLSCPIYCHM